jgi:YHS domain-containing protein
MYKKIIALLIISIVIFTSSCSKQTQEASKKLEAEKTEIIEVNNQYCPISGEKIEDALAATYVYEGKRYRFCCAGCISRFKKDPEKYIKIIEEGNYPSGGGMH